MDSTYEKNFTLLPYDVVTLNPIQGNQPDLST